MSSRGLVVHSTALKPESGFESASRHQPSYRALGLVETKEQFLNETQDVLVSPGLGEGS